MLRLIEVDVGGVEQSGLELRNPLVQRSFNRVGGPLDSRDCKSFLQKTHLKLIIFGTDTAKVREILMVV